MKKKRGEKRKCRNEIFYFRKQGASCNGSNGAENGHCDPDPIPIFVW